MKPAVLAIGLFLFTLSLTAQTLQVEQKEYPFLKKVVNEFYFSVNATVLGEAYVKQLGGGVGINHSFHLGKRVEYLLGAEFIHTSVLERNDDTYYGVPIVTNPALSYQYYLNSISFPTGFRYNFGRKFKFYLEHGISYNLTINSKEIKISSSESRINENFSIPNAPGIFLGMGVRIPGTNVEYIVKSSFRVVLIQTPLAFMWKLDVGFKWK